uniref:Ankyrin repeat domain 13B n=2 Tax=Cyprinus carpio TaxID=7962 RepID=A0A9J7YM93_CYPCA
MISARKTPEKSRYHLHYLVWHNKHRQLEKELSAREQVDLEVLDPRGRTPLHLAVTLAHLECARLLVQHGADVSRENRNGWTALHSSRFMHTDTQTNRFMGNRRVYIIVCLQDLSFPFPYQIS